MPFFFVAVVAAALRESLGVAPPTDFESVSFASVHQEGRARLGGDGKVPRLAGAAAVPHPQGEGSLLLNPSNGFANGSHGEPSSRSSPSPSLNSSAASAAGASARWGGSNQGQQAMLRAMGSQMPSMGALCSS
ncbi:hypothetical protein T492DRAFT_839222 [Pavlovales sp. CCMP2436]|nr:hypothetical protein T492DRAFT_839222 [Pavlovales sp. CCMP2436]